MCLCDQHKFKYHQAFTKWFLSPAARQSYCKPKENIYLLMAIADKEAMRKAAGDALNEDGGNVMAKCSKEVTEEAAGDEDGDKK